MTDKISQISKNEYRQRQTLLNKVLHWLSWLATKMVDESKIIFLIEKMQPTLLESRSEKKWYRIENFVLRWLICGLVYGLDDGLDNGLVSVH